MGCWNRGHGRFDFWDKCPLIELCDYNIPEDEDEPEKPKPSPPNCERFAWAGKVELILNTCVT